MATVKDIKLAPWDRLDWTGELISADGADAADFKEEDVAEVLHYAQTADDWDGDTVGVVRLKDGRFGTDREWLLLRRLRGNSRHSFRTHQRSRDVSPERTGHGSAAGLRGEVMAEQNFVRERVKALAAETKAQRKLYKDAESNRIRALDVMQSARDLVSLNAGIAQEQAARSTESIAKTALIAALEAELHVVKMMLEVKS